MFCGLRCEAGGCSGRGERQAQGKRKKRATHTSSVMVPGHGMQYNSR
jgi:hypothetical protein